MDQRSQSEILRAVANDESVLGFIKPVVKIWRPTEELKGEMSSRVIEILDYPAQRLIKE